MSGLTLLDGGMGQELLRRSKRKVTTLWSADIMLHEPELVNKLHSDFIDSGAQIITLNTYTATPQRLKRDGHFDKLEELHQKASQAALDAVRNSGKTDIKIAGCLPPLVASYQPNPALPYDTQFASYQHLVELQTSASDLFICETMSSITEASAALSAAKLTNKPVWVAFSVSDDSPLQLRSGESLLDAVNAIMPLSPDAILLNCSQPEAISKALCLLSDLKVPIGAYANGFVSVTSLFPGTTVETLETRQDLNPQQYKKYAQEWLDNGAAIIGGCCEIGPKHIDALQSLTRN